MADVINLADPAFEPSDEQLIGLSSRAFAGVAAAHERALAKLRVEIETLRARAMHALDEREATARKSGKEP
jgi:hypothetical protein